MKNFMWFAQITQLGHKHGLQTPRACQQSWGLRLRTSGRPVGCFLWAEVPSLTPVVPPTRLVQSTQGNRLNRPRLHAGPGHKEESKKGSCSIVRVRTPSKASSNMPSPCLHTSREKDLHLSLATCFTASDDGKVYPNVHAPTVRAHIY